MEDKSFPSVSFADIVKGNKCTDKLSSRAESWFEQIEKFEIDTISRSNSVSTIMSDDTESCRRLNVNRHSISHSLDSGQVSDLSSDNETCSKSSTECQLTSTQISYRNRTKQFLQRRKSDDSSTSGESVSKIDQVSMICKRWARMDMKYERDEGVLARRQKQIDFGKNTTEYRTYRKQISRDERTSEQPQTPDKSLKYSRRAFDGLVKIWRKKLHHFDLYDPSEPSEISEPDECSESQESKKHSESKEHSKSLKSETSEPVNSTSPDLPKSEQ